MFEASEALQKMEGMKRIKSMSFHQYSWNSEAETTPISLIGWHHKTSTIYCPKEICIIPSAAPALFFRLLGTAFTAVRRSENLWGSGALICQKGGKGAHVLLPHRFLRSCCALLLSVFWPSRVQVCCWHCTIKKSYVQIQPSFFPKKNDYKLNSINWIETKLLWTVTRWSHFKSVLPFTNTRSYSVCHII